MVHLEVKSGPFRAIKNAVAILNILAAVAMFIAYFREYKIIPLIASFFIALNGIYLITNGFGLERTWLRTGYNFILIKWINMIAPVQLHDIRIDKIIFERSQIVIHLKSKRPLKLRLDHLEKEQKKEVYEFMIDYSKQHNINLEKRYNTPVLNS
jgi:hypothetical protein